MHLWSAVLAVSSCTLMTGDIPHEASEGTNTFNVVRRVTFCAGHRVFGHESKCRNLHGHNYVALFHASPVVSLDSLGRVVDFAVLKDRLGGWIQEHWDHGFLLWERDADAIAAVSCIPDQKLFVLPANPTAENLAHHLLCVVAPAVLGDVGVVVHQVVLWETENCYAEVRRHVGQQPR